jgi:hypothetical protein
MTYIKRNLEFTLDDSLHEKIEQIDELKSTLSKFVDARNALIDDHTLISKAAEVYLEMKIQREIKSHALNGKTVTEQIRFFIVTGIEIRIAECDKNITTLVNQLFKMIK